MNKGVTCTYATSEKCKQSSDEFFVTVTKSTNLQDRLQVSGHPQNQRTKMPITLPIIAKQVSGCNTACGAYATSPNTQYFGTSSKSVTAEDNCGKSTTCYRATNCKYTDIPTAIFNTSVSYASGGTCYRGTSCKTENLNTQFFNTSSMNKGVTCNYATSAKCSVTNTSFFTTSSVATTVNTNTNIWNPRVSGTEPSTDCSITKTTTGLSTDLGTSIEKVNW